MNKLFYEMRIARHMAVVRAQKTIIWEQLLEEAADNNDKDGIQHLLEMAECDNAIRSFKNYCVNRYGLLERDVQEQPFEYHIIGTRIRCVPTGREVYYRHIGWRPTFREES